MTRTWTCEGYETSEPVWSQPSQPALVRGHPELISVLFLGARRIITRDLFDTVRDIIRRP